MTSRNPRNKRYDLGHRYQSSLASPKSQVEGAIPTEVTVFEPAIIKPTAREIDKTEKSDII